MFWVVDRWRSPPSVYTFDVPTLSVLLLMPMMALTYFFWDAPQDRRRST